MKKRLFVEQAGKQHRVDKVHLEKAKKASKELWVLYQNLPRIIPTEIEIISKRGLKDLKGILYEINKFQWSKFSSKFLEMCKSINKLGYLRLSTLSIASKSGRQTESLLIDLSFFSCLTPADVAAYLIEKFTTESEDESLIKKCLENWYFFSVEMEKINDLFGVMTAALSQYIDANFEEKMTELSEDHRKLSDAVQLYKKILIKLNDHSSNIRMLEDVRTISDKLLNHEKILRNISSSPEGQTEKINKELEDLIYNAIAIDIGDFVGIISMCKNLVKKLDDDNHIADLEKHIEAIDSALESLRADLENKKYTEVLDHISFDDSFDFHALKNLVLDGFRELVWQYLCDRRSIVDLVQTKKFKIENMPIRDLLLESNETPKDLLNKISNIRNFSKNLEDDCVVINKKIEEISEELKKRNLADSPENLSKFFSSIYSKKTQENFSFDIIHGLFIYYYRQKAVERILSLLNGLRNQYHDSSAALECMVLQEDKKESTIQKYKNKLFIDSIARIGQLAKGFKECYPQKTALYQLLKNWADIRDVLYHQRDLKKNARHITRLLRKEELLSLNVRILDEISELSSFFEKHLYEIQAGTVTEKLSQPNDIITDLFEKLAKMLVDKKVPLMSRINKIKKIEVRLLEVNKKLQVEGIGEPEKQTLVAIRIMLEKDLGQLMRYLPDEEYIAEIDEEVDGYFIETDTDSNYKNFTILDVQSFAFFSECRRHRGKLCHNELIVDLNASLPDTALEKNKAELDRAFGSE